MSILVRNVIYCSCAIPVYNLQLYVYPVLLSANTKAFIPHLVGFLGMYCRKDSLPLNPIMDFIDRDLPTRMVGFLKSFEQGGLKMAIA